MQDGVESESEAVTLGEEDPYSDYSLSADSLIMGYHPATIASPLPHASPPTPRAITLNTSSSGGARRPPPRLTEQYARIDGPPMEDMVPSSDFTDIFAASVFGGGAAEDHPCDPYYF